MKIGLFLQPATSPKRQLYESVNWNIDVIKKADELGYAEAWIGQHIKSPWEPLTSPKQIIARSIGETSTLLIIIGALFLLITKIASWRIMFGTLIGMIFTAKLTNIFALSTNSTNSMLYLPAEYHLVMGSFAFGLVFMATDPVSASQTNAGRWIYGILIGFMCVIIRSINPAYPEGMMLGILFANAFSPLIDYFVMKSHIKQSVKRFNA